MTVRPEDLLAVEFEGHRLRLQAVAYRMLGSLAEAEDAVQEAWLRLARADAGDIGNLAGWLTTVVGRVCLDMLRVRKARREDSLEARLPDPLVSRDGAADPEQQALLADSVGLALQVVLESLTPAERLAFVLSREQLRAGTARSATAPYAVTKPAGGPSTTARPVAYDPLGPGHPLWCYSDIHKQVQCRRADASVLRRSCLRPTRRPSTMDGCWSLLVSALGPAGVDNSYLRSNQPARTKRKRRCESA